MKLKENLIHRLRDFESVLRARKKLSLFMYVVLRQLCKLTNYEEARFKSLIKNNVLTFKGCLFHIRQKTLDFLFLSRFYEPETLKFIDGLSGKAFINVGAHIGRYAVIEAKKFEKIYAFEPQPSNFRSLRKNIFMNKLCNVHLINKAASSHAGELSFSGLNVNTGAARIVEDGKNVVYATTLDRFIQQKKVNFNDVDLVLYDVENHELEALRGSKKLLCEGSPLLIIEAFDPEKIEPFLQTFGYAKVKTLDFYNYVFAKRKY